MTGFYRSMESDEVESLHSNLTWQTYFLPIFLHELCFSQNVCSVSHISFSSRCAFSSSPPWSPKSLPSPNLQIPPSGSHFPGSPVCEVIILPLLQFCHSLLSLPLSIPSFLSFFLNYYSTCKNSSFNSCLQPGSIRYLFLVKGIYLLE